MIVAQDNSDCFEHILKKFALWKAVRICSWIARFVGNLRIPVNSRISGPQTTEEIEQQYTFWEKRVQRDCDYGDDKERLNLQENHHARCLGMQRSYPRPSSNIPARQAYLHDQGGRRCPFTNPTRGSGDEHV